MATLLVGFDSAWTAANAGALVGVMRQDDGTLRELGPPQTANFHDAEAMVLKWQQEEAPPTTLVLLDQPTIVRNAGGQRPVENIVSSPVGLRYGGIQPANTAKTDMFGTDAPVWGFLSRFGGAADPLKPRVETSVFETYPVLAMMAMGWTLPDHRPGGRLPKYNPKRRKTFSISDWRYVCTQASATFRERAVSGAADWLDELAQITAPQKSDQDRLDAYLCLLVALYLGEQRDCLMVGNMEAGYIVVPHAAGLQAELVARCQETDRPPADWVRVFRLGSPAATQVN